MKNRILTLLMISFISVLAVSAQKSSKLSPMGTWKFAAPYAPEGYSSGTIVFGLADQKNIATMSFAGSEYKMTGENLKIKNDSIFYSIFLEGQDIKVLLKVVSDTNMSGKAVYSEGEVPLALSKVIAEKTR